LCISRSPTKGSSDEDEICADALEVSRESGADGLVERVELLLRRRGRVFRRGGRGLFAVLVVGAEKEEVSGGREMRAREREERFLSSPGVVESEGRVSLLFNSPCAFF